MNKDLQIKLSQVEALIGIQKDCLYENGEPLDYMHGMLNGLICAHSVLTNTSPRYYTRPKRRTKIRHKGKK